MPTLPPTADLTSRRFGKWLVLRPDPRDSHRSPSTRRWVCRCECGREQAILSCSLRTPNGTRQCRHCANETARDALADSPKATTQRASLTDPVWPRVCLACGRGFLGASRAWYCSQECRPSGQKSHRERGRSRKKPA